MRRSFCSLQAFSRPRPRPFVLPFGHQYPAVPFDHQRSAVRLFTFPFGRHHYPISVCSNQVGRGARVSFATLLYRRALHYQERLKLTRSCRHGLPFCYNFNPFFFFMAIMLLTNESTHYLGIFFFILAMMSDD